MKSLRSNREEIMAGGWLAILCFILFLIPFSGTLQAQNLEEFEQKVTEFTLENGLHFIIIQRDVAPVASFLTYVNVGGVDEPVGNTGIAHIFEHMAFKGTDIIGTTDWQAEQGAIEDMEKAYLAWLEASRNGASEEELSELWNVFTAAQDASKQYVVNNEFSRIIEQSGGVGLNAFTSSDETAYFYSLPVNKAELWFNLESARFRTPVFREFYVEKDVVMEERRMRTDSNPLGRLIERFLKEAYEVHPYGNPVVGWAEDIKATTITDARAFYETFYVPSNMTIAIAGDVDPAEMRRLAELYFGGFAAGNPVPEPGKEEPRQTEERRFIMQDASQPVWLAGYQTVSNSHPDFAALSLLGDIISVGRTSRFYKALVEESQKALAVQALNGFPGTRYPSLFVTFAIPNQGVDVLEIESMIEAEIAKVQQGDISQDELDRAITNRRADIVRSLNSNSGLALNAATFHMQQGSWKGLFTQLDEFSSVTLADLQRVANDYLVTSNRTVGIIQNNATASSN